MPTYTMTRQVTYTVRSRDTQGTADPADDTWTDQVHTRTESYEVTLPEPPDSSVLDPSAPLPPTARLTSASDFEDLDGDGRQDAGEASLATPATGPVGDGSLVEWTDEEALLAVEQNFIASTGNPGTIGGAVTDYLRVDAAADAETERLLSLDAALEEQALAVLSPEDQARYQALRDALADDPRARLALQSLLISGALPGAPALAPTEGAGDEPLTLLQQLEALSQADTAAGLFGAETLLATVVKELAFPEAISQGPKGTCTVTSAAIALAMAHPAEYVRLVMGLASPEGTVRMANGELLAREADTVADDGTGRTVTQRLLGPALMEYGNGILDYKNGDDVNTAFFGGLWPGGHAAVASALFGQPFEGYAHPTTWFGAGTQVTDAVRDAVEAGVTPVMVLTEFPGPFDLHSLIVLGVEEVDGQTYFTLLNPWGQVERVSYDELASNARGMVYPK